MAELTPLEEAVICAVRDGQEPGEIRQEVEAALLMAWNLKLRTEDPAWGVKASR